MSPDWTFGGRWPYEPTFFDTPEGRIAYMDEGSRSAPPVVLLHGNPTWGYLFRRLLPPLLSAGRRAIAVDHLGFGRSDKPRDAAAYRIPRHVDRLGALLDSLDLSNAVLVVHDWGGPIGLPWAIRNPDRLAGLVVLNTFAPRLPGPIGSRASVRATGSRVLGPLLVKHRDVATEGFLFKAGLAHPEHLDERDKEAYRMAHPDPASRTAMLVFPREIPFRDSGPVAELTAEIERGVREHFQHRPAQIVWGMKDVLFGPRVLELWEEALPQADVVTIPDAGHFVPEDAPEELAEAIVDFVVHRSVEVTAASGALDQPAPEEAEGREGEAARRRPARDHGDLGQ